MSVCPCVPGTWMQIHGAPSCLQGHEAEDCRKGLRQRCTVGGAVGMQDAAQKCWALWTCTAHSIKVYLSSGLECVCSSAQHQKLSGFHTDRFVFIDLLVLFIQGGFVQVRKGICPWKSLFMMGLRYAQIPHLQQFLFSHVPNKDGC